MAYIVVKDTLHTSAANVADVNVYQVTFDFAAQGTYLVPIVEVIEEETLQIPDDVVVPIEEAVVTAAAPLKNAPITIVTFESEEAEAESVQPTIGGVNMDEEGNMNMDFT